MCRGGRLAVSTAGVGGKFVWHIGIIEVSFASCKSARRTNAGYSSRFPIRYARGRPESICLIRSAVVPSVRHRPL